MHDESDVAPRLQELARYSILDQDRETAFDDIVEIACGLLGAPYGMITLVDAERQWLLSEIGIGRRETSLEGSFCAVAMNQSETLVVEETLHDPR